jgi:formylmethanofuran dehydrogenase subunit B
MSSGPTPASSEPRTTPKRRSVADVTCLACGCLCDDLTVMLEGDRVVEVLSACEVGRSWFFSESGREPAIAASIEGKPVSTEEAIARAVSVLGEARSPVVFGLTRTVTESVREALGLADLLGARVVLDRSGTDLGRVSAYQGQGRVTATLGEVKNRADLVVFWGADPVRTHPRHWERYSVGPKGRFVPEGRAGRTVVVVDAEKTATAERADHFVQVPADRHLEALATLRMLARGKTPARPTAGFETLLGLADLMKRARYGAMFVQGGEDSGWRSGATWEAAARLVRVLNDFTRFVLLGLGAAGNLAGAEAALTWQSGYLQGVDFRLGHPSPLDDLVTIDELLKHREIDAVLVVGDGLPTGLSDQALAHLGSIPSIVIGSRATAVSDSPPTVALATWTPGFDARGTVVRTDGVAIRTRPVRDARLPGDGELIRKIVDGVKQAVKAS